MSTAGCATPTAPQDSQSEAIEKPHSQASKRLKGLLIGFAGTVTVGLALAIWYVDLRIVDASVAVPRKTMVSAPLAAAPKIAPAALPSGATPMPTPEAGKTDLYLQLPALGRHETARYLKSLHAKGFHVQTQTEAETDSTNIVIGPFSSHSELERARRQLKSVGLLALQTADSFETAP